MLKVSGEIFDSDAALSDFVREMKILQKKGVKIGIVVGGGNIWRFRDHADLKLDRVTSDTMGMVATIINALALVGALKSGGVAAVGMSALKCEKAIENYEIKKAKKYFDSGEVVVFAGGTGSPFFTTDSAAALRGVEMKCDVVMKATKVDYVYDKDPLKFKNAKKFTKMTFAEVMDKNLGVMDIACAAICEEGRIPMLVFNMSKRGNIEKAVGGVKIGTLITFN